MSSVAEQRIADWIAAGDDETLLDLSSLGLECLPASFPYDKVYKLDCSNNRIKGILSLPVCVRLYCYSNLITYINAPYIMTIDCSDNLLCHIYFEYAEYIKCMNNFIESINAPNAIDVDCSNNLLPALSLPNVKTLDCDGNYISKFNLPKISRAKRVKFTQLAQILLFEPGLNTKSVNTNLRRSSRVPSHVGSLGRGIC